MRYLFSLILLSGCQSVLPAYIPIEESRASIAVAIAMATCEVIQWEGELPLTGEPAEIIESAAPVTPPVAAKPKEYDSIQWQPSMSKAIELSRQTGKPILAHTLTSFCGPCKILERTTFLNQEFINAVNDSFIPVKVNLTETPRLSRQWGVSRVPTDIVFKVSGDKASEVVRMVGYTSSVEEYLKRLRMFVDAVKASNRKVVPNVQSKK